MRLTTFTIEDPIGRSSTGAIEVVVNFDNGTRRWCFFMAPEALSRCGDIVEGSDVRVHPGVPHMFVLSRIDEILIEKVLRNFDAAGELIAHTASME